MVDEVLTQFGRVDILINNAGYRPRRTFRDMTTAEWRAVLATNLDGPFFCAKAVVPSMISNGGGSIVNLSGMNSFSGAHWPHVCGLQDGRSGPDAGSCSGARAAQHPRQLSRAGRLG